MQRLGRLVQPLREPLGAAARLLPIVATMLAADD
jgi:hypothetical protein